MSLRYSPSMGGFYDTDLHADIPADAIYIRPARHAELMLAQAEGATIVPSQLTGCPIAALPSTNELRERLIIATKAEAKRRIERISPWWRQVNDLREPTSDSLARFTEIDAVRSASDAIEQCVLECPAAELVAFAVLDHSLWPEDIA